MALFCCLRFDLSNYLKAVARQPILAGSERTWVLWLILTGSVLELRDASLVW